MKKYILNLRVLSKERYLNQFVCLRLTNPGGPLPPILPGQFAQVRIDNASDTFLRRPISIHFVDYGKNELWFLVQMVGEGTRKLGDLTEGDTLNAILPLGNGFSLPVESSEKVLLAGGGVGIAPLLYLGKCLKDAGFSPTFLLGARSKDALLQIPLFEKLGSVCLTTEDGSAGEKGFVTQHSLLKGDRFTRLYCCGPKPMMLAVARLAHSKGMDCEVSLENQMACGIGACLCCVEDTLHGNVCVCKEGPVFNIKDLRWQI